MSKFIPEQIRTLTLEDLVARTVEADRERRNLREYEEDQVGVLIRGILEVFRPALPAIVQRIERSEIRPPGSDGTREYFELRGVLIRDNFNEKPAATRGRVELVGDRLYLLEDGTFWLQTRSGVGFEDDVTPDTWTTFSTSHLKIAEAIRLVQPQPLAKRLAELCAQVLRADSERSPEAQRRVDRLAAVATLLNT